MAGVQLLKVAVPPVTVLVPTEFPLTRNSTDWPSTTPVVVAVSGTGNSAIAGCAAATATVEGDLTALTVTWLDVEGLTVFDPPYRASTV